LPDVGNKAETSGDSSSTASRVLPWLLVLLGALLLIAGAVVWNARRQAALQTKEEVARARARRAEPVVELALAPLPVQTPLLERAGKDADGYPLSYVDRVAARSLLGRGKYAELTSYLEKFQADFEADPHNEYWINDAAEAFESAEPALLAKLDEWAKATPRSFAPYLARGVHRFAAGAAGRGTKWAKDTHADDMKAMDDAFASALDDLHQALMLKAGVMPALRYQLRIALMSGAHHGLFEPVAKRAFALCPACFIARVTYQVGLEPRWGGSYERMAAAAADASPSVNPRFKQLAGYADADRAEAEIRNENLDSALALIERACALGDNADFLAIKADILNRRKEFGPARSAANRALELRPQRPNLLYRRARIASTGPAKDWQTAYTDLSMALRLEPNDSEARSLLAYIAKGLATAGWEAHQAGNDTDAIRWLDEASELLPNKEFEQRRVEVLTSGFHGTDAEIAELEQRAKADRHDFYAHARLDYALSKRGEWPRIAAMWNAYVTENPNDGRALVELGGTLMHQGRVAQARVAVARACELGVSKGCLIAKRL
jgi:Flp pilus assembly protein TadD